jgi:2-polyprenyl-3-methyl-5-hydroxy-6-metoxy-1,4-benzoquinol methylase
MNTGTTRSTEPVVTKENIQDFYSAILEYYDELFPLDETAIPFFLSLQQKLKNASPEKTSPLCRFLGIGCATGNLENKLAPNNMDITGIDKNPDMIETAKRRMKRGYSTIRFFEMSSIDMKRFLKARSFQIIACIDNTLPYIADETLIRKFFYDAKELLAPGGILVIQTINMEGLESGKPKVLEERSSIRVSLSRSWIPISHNLYALDAMLEMGNGKKLALQKTANIIALSTSRLESYAREAGFTGCNLQADFSGSRWDSSSANSVMLFT